MKLSKGQSILENALLLIILIGALVAGGSYIKRGIQGHWKESLDGLGEQYDPTNMQTNVRYMIDSNSTTVLTTQRGVTGFWTNRVDTANSVETKTGSMNVAAY